MTTKDQWRASIRPRIERARQTLREVDPVYLADYCGGKLQDGTLQLSLLTTPLKISTPEFIVQSNAGAICPEETQILILDYLLFSKNRSMRRLDTPYWIAFQEIPDGAFYAKAFRSYTSDVIMGRLDGDTDRFRRISMRIGGKAFPMGDASFSFQVLPGIYLAIIWWAGDEEFPAYANVLFDQFMARALPIDGMAALGRLLCRQFLAAVDKEDEDSRRTIDAAQSTRSHHV